MARIADRVHTDATQIERIERLIRQMSDGDRVSLLLEDGQVVEGIVAMRATPQVFFDRDGRAAINAMVRLAEEVGTRASAGWRELRVETIREGRQHQVQPPGR